VAYSDEIVAQSLAING